MFVKTFAGAVVGIDAVTVTVEVNIAGGGLGLYLVGLPDNAVKESEQRIRAAFENSGERMSGRKVVVNLAPADLRKEGAAFDLPIAVGILAAMGRVDAAAVADTLFAGELSLDGTVKSVRGVLPMAVQARRDGVRRLVIPAANAAEAAVVGVSRWSAWRTCGKRSHGSTGRRNLPRPWRRSAKRRHPCRAATMRISPMSRVRRMSSVRWRLRRPADTTC